MRLQAGAVEAGRPVEFRFGDVVLKALLGEAHSDFAETGQVVWPGGCLLAHFLLSVRGRALTRGAHVVELGAGVGIPGLLAAMEGGADRVVLTDHNPRSIDLLEGNVMLNAEAAGRCPDVSVAMLDWDNAEQAHRLGRSFGLVLGADVVYSVASAEVLLRAGVSLLSDAPGACMVLAYVSRWPQVDTALVRAAEKLGLCMTEVPRGEFLSEGDVSAEIGGGGDSAIYIVARAGGGGGGGWGVATAVVSEEGEVTVTASDLAAGALGEGGLAACGGAVRGLTVRHSGALTMSLGACEALGAALAGVAGGLESLRLERQRVGADGADCLGRGIALCTGLQRLALPGSCLGPDGMDRLRRCMSSGGGCGGAACALRELDLQGNGIGDEGLEHLRGLLRGGELRSLGLSLNGLTDAGVGALAKDLPCTLESLDLSSNAVSSEGVRALAREGNDLLARLATLDLSCCALRSEVAPPRCRRLPSALVPLQALKRRADAAQGAEALADSMKHMGLLSVLRLRSCWLSDDGVTEVSLGLPLCPLLRELDLSSNGVGCEGGRSLAEALGELEAGGREGRALSLLLRRNGIQGEGALELVRACGACCVRVDVDLADNPLGEEGGALLAGDPVAEQPAPTGGGAGGSVSLRACGISGAEGREVVRVWGLRGVRVDL